MIQTIQTTLVMWTFVCTSALTLCVCTFLVGIIDDIEYELHELNNNLNETQSTDTTLPSANIDKCKMSVNRSSLSKHSLAIEIQKMSIHNTINLKLCGIMHFYFQVKELSCCVFLRFLNYFNHFNYSHFL